MQFEFSKLKCFLFLHLIALSAAVTVNFRNLTFGSLADRIALANQHKIQAQTHYENSQAQQNVIITTSTTTSTIPPPAEPEVEVVLPSSPEPPISQNPVQNIIITNKPIVTSNNNAKDRWCNVSVFKKSRVTWLSAYRTCKRLGNGTELASIKSQDDYDTFVSNVKDAGSPASVIYWTSGTDILDEGEFVWMSDGSEVTQTWWAPGQPDNHWDTEHCIAFKRYTNETNYKMTDENCLMAGAFICAQPCKFWV